MSRPISMRKVFTSIFTSNLQRYMRELRRTEEETRSVAYYFMLFYCRDIKLSRAPFVEFMQHYETAEVSLVHHSRLP